MSIKTIKILLKSSAVIGLTLFTSFVFSASAETPEKTKTTLFDFSGKQVQFENYIKSNSQWTVVMLWASDCHVCNVEANQFVKLHREYKDKNIRVLGVSVDGQARKTAANEFINIHNINFPNLIGEPEVIANLFNHYTSETWVGTPTFMVFSPAGKVMAQRVGMLPPELIVSFIEKQSE